MPQETVGYVKLEWTCKRCGSKNPGTTRICASCGNVMSETDKFELPAQQQLIQDEKEMAQAQVGPDITCKYCGARNRADAKNCSQCSADLTEGTARQAGQVLGALDTTAKPDLKCPYCGEMNPATALKCKKCAGSLAARPIEQPKPATAPAAPPNSRLMAIVGVAVLAVCALVFILMTRTSDTTATVNTVQWQRQIAIMALRPVTRETWKDQVPANAQLGDCVDKVRRTQNDPAPNSEKICGTPYTVDQGNGTGKVVQDCQYQVKDAWCEYTRDELGVVDTVVARGTDTHPTWPALNLLAGQSEGDRVEEYTIVFTSDNKRYEYQTSDAGEFAQFTIGSRWKLTVNGLGGVVKVEAAK